MRAIVLAGALALATSAAAAAQSTMSHSGLRPGLMDMDVTGDPAAALPTSDYVLKSGQSDQFEIQEGRMASSMARSAAVRAFGRMMVEAHGSTSAALARALGDMGQPAPPPPPLTVDEQAQLDQLRGLSGGEFDRAYVRQQLSAHEEALRIQADYARGGSDPQLRAIAAAAAPVVRAHLARLARLRTEVGA